MKRCVVSETTEQLVTLCVVRFVVITPSVLQVGIDHKVIVAFYSDVRKSVGVKVDVELDNRTKVFSGTAVQVSGQQGRDSHINLPHPAAAMHICDFQSTSLYFRPTRVVCRFV